MPSIVCLPRAWDRHLKNIQIGIGAKPQPVTVCEQNIVCERVSTKENK